MRHPHKLMIKGMREALNFKTSSLSRIWLIFLKECVLSNFKWQSTLSVDGECSFILGEIFSIYVTKPLEIIQVQFVNLLKEICVSWRQELIFQECILICTFNKTKSPQLLIFFNLLWFIYILQSKNQVKKQKIVNIYVLIH